MRELIERLREIGEEEGLYECDQAANALEAAEAMAAALGPFAEASSHLHPSHPADGETLDGFKVKQFWAANIALANWEALK